LGGPSNCFFLCYQVEIRYTQVNVMRKSANSLPITQRQPTEYGPFASSTCNPEKPSESRSLGVWRQFQLLSHLRSKFVLRRNPHIAALSSPFVLIRLHVNRRLLMQGARPPNTSSCMSREQGPSVSHAEHKTCLMKSMRFKDMSAHGNTANLRFDLIQNWPVALQRRASEMGHGPSWGQP
jgi:hypothetical protein